MLVPCFCCKGAGKTTSRFCDYDEHDSCDVCHATGKIEYDLDRDENFIHYISDNLNQYGLYSDNRQNKEGILKYFLLRLFDLYSQTNTSYEQQYENLLSEYMDLNRKYQNLEYDYNNLKDEPDYLYKSEMNTCYESEYIAKYNKVKPFINKAETMEFIGWED